MKPGDLVRYGSTTPNNRTPIQKVAGLVVEDKTMMCSIGVVTGGEPYRMGRMLILWSDGRGVREEVYANLEVLNEAG